MKALGFFVFPSSRLFTNPADATLDGSVLSPPRPPGGALHLRWLNTRWGDVVYICGEAIKHWWTKKTEALAIVGCTEAGDLRVTAAPPDRHFGGKTMCLLGDWVNVPTLLFFLTCEMPLNNPNHTAFLLRKLDKQLGQGTLFTVDLFVRQRCRPSLVSNGSSGAFVLRLSSLRGLLAGWLVWYRCSFPGCLNGGGFVFRGGERRTVGCWTSIAHFCIERKPVFWYTGQTISQVVLNKYGNILLVQGTISKSQLKVRKFQVCKNSMWTTV